MQDGIEIKVGQIWQYKYTPWLITKILNYSVYGVVYNVKIAIFEHDVELTLGSNLSLYWQLLREQQEIIDNIYIALQVLLERDK